VAPATEPRLAVIGTGRSGSGYLAALLNAAGVTCGHEQWWNPQGERTAGLAADSSWCAVPDLTRFSGTIGHQVRNPLHTVASLTQLPDHGPYAAWRERIMGPLGGDPFEDAVRVVVEWNAACERLTSFRWRVEDTDADLITELGAAAGVAVSAGAAADALASTAGNVNDHGTDHHLHWGDLPYTHATNLLADMAERYGYR
jgi:hypothetical protein